MSGFVISPRTKRLRRVTVALGLMRATDVFVDLTNQTGGGAGVGGLSKQSPNRLCSKNINRFILFVYALSCRCKLKSRSSIYVVLIR